MNVSKNSLQIKEEDKFQDKWYEQAKEISSDEDLIKFINNLEYYEHDYGTICHAVAAAAIAAANRINHGEQGGITGFQANAIMWQFIRQWTGKSGALRLVSYSDMLYPNLAEKFEKIISEDSFKILQKEAKELLESFDDSNQISDKLKTHLEAIISGIPPFGYTIV